MTNGRRQPGGSIRQRRKRRRAAFQEYSEKDQTRDSILVQSLHKRSKKSLKEKEKWGLNTPVVRFENILWDINRARALYLRVYTINIA